MLCSRVYHFSLYITEFAALPLGSLSSLLRGEIQQLVRSRMLESAEVKVWSGVEHRLYFFIPLM